MPEAKRVLYVYDAEESSELTIHGVLQYFSVAKDGSLIFEII